MKIKMKAYFRDEVAQSRLIEQTMKDWCWNCQDVFGVSDDLIKHFEILEENKFLQFHPKILAFNVNTISSHKYQTIQCFIAEFDPAFVFIMEAWTKMKCPVNYYAYELNDLYCTTIWIRQDLVRGRMIKRIPYGIQVDEFCFRYIPGGSPKTELNGIFEIGDYNYNSNKWMNLENFYV